MFSLITAGGRRYASIITYFHKNCNSFCIDL